MKTTIELPDDLFLKIKVLAAERRTTLKDVVIQALNLFNSPFTIEEANALAARVEAEVSQEAAAAASGELLKRQIVRAFELALGRSPDDIEFGAAEDVVGAHGLPTLCRVLFNSNEFVFVP